MSDPLVPDELDPFDDPLDVLVVPDPLVEPLDELSLALRNGSVAVFVVFDELFLFLFFTYISARAASESLKSMPSKPFFIQFWMYHSACVSDMPSSSLYMSFMSRELCAILPLAVLSELDDLDLDLDDELPLSVPVVLVVLFVFELLQLFEFSQPVVAWLDTVALLLTVALLEFVLLQLVEIVLDTESLQLVESLTDVLQLDSSVWLLLQLV